MTVVFIGSFIIYGFFKTYCGHNAKNDDIDRLTAAYSLDSTLVEFWSNFSRVRGAEIPLAEIEPAADSFFILETSGRSRLTPKELCTIESAALHHPNHTIYVLMTSPTVDWPIALNAYKNVIFKRVSVDRFIESSPLKDLWTSECVQKSDFLTSHLSDVLRYLVLFKYGGTYLDSDQIVLRHFPALPNFVGRESFWVGK